MLKQNFIASLVLLACAGIITYAQGNPFLGKWDITGTGQNSDHVYWLEVKMEGDKLVGYFLNRGGSVTKLPQIALENGELVFSPSANSGRAVHRAKVQDGKLLGTLTSGEQQIAWIGVRPPKWGAYNANGKHKFGTPVVLFDGKTLDNWGVQVKDRPSGWSIVDGAMTNSPHANNLVSKHRFEDFKIQCEYKVENNSNSGIYLRGRYELQVLDDAGKPTESHGHMSLYSRVAPLVNASLPPGQWQTMEATIVGNKVTVFLNGKKVQDNITIDGITGGALDSNEGEPGPIMIQGDHEKITYRKVVVTPILK
jgi:3-keto-disaccharide hydrolase